MIESTDILLIKSSLLSIVYDATAIADWYLNARHSSLVASLCATDFIDNANYRRFSISAECANRVCANSSSVIQLCDFVTMASNVHAVKIYLIQVCLETFRF